MACFKADLELLSSPALDPSQSCEVLIALLCLEFHSGSFQASMTSFSCSIFKILIFGLKLSPLDAYRFLRKPIPFSSRALAKFRKRYVFSKNQTPFCEAN